MTVVYQVEFRESSLIRTMPDSSKETSPVNLKEIQQMEKICKDYSWNQSKLSQQIQIGEKLFTILNGDKQTLIRALKEADDYGERLQVILRGDGSAFNLPFELLYYNDFLVPSKIHLIRKVSDRGRKRTLTPENRPLKILLMACSPQDVNPVLDFEKEEDTILEVTKDLPIEIDIEDTGSLEGLGERLDSKRYDIIHITGHADIDKNGTPIFLMENEEGMHNDVAPLQLWKKLDLNMPKLVFLSGCKTGQIPEEVAAMSFAQELVAGGVPAVLGWGLPVTDAGARTAAVKLYYDLSRGEDPLEALRRTRKELFDRHRQDWSLLRLFSDGAPLENALVTRGQIRPIGMRELQYAYLNNSQVKVLTKGFIGRRRQMQQGLRCLKKDGEKVGLLLHGTGGLGKSCLAGKLCERFKEHTLIIVHGELNAYKFIDALKDAFFRGNDDNGIKILDIKENLPDKIRRLCSSAFLNKKYLILLDDFEKNLPEIKEGEPAICVEAVPIIESLLRFLPNSCKMTQLIITSRYTFPLTFDGRDLVKDKLEYIGLTSFRGADERKKISELINIASYPEPEIRQRLINMGHGNPRLMEYLNTLVGEVKGLDIDLLLSRAKNKQDEFVEGLVLRQLLDTQSEEFLSFLRNCSVYRLPVLKDGIGMACDDFKDWESHSEKAVRLSLIERDSSSKDLRYWVTPLLRESLFKELGDDEKNICHQAAVSYYQNVLSITYDPVSSVELIRHALSAGLNEIAIDESGERFLPYLRKNLAFNEALEHGEYVRSCISEIKRNENWSKFLFELGWIYLEIGKTRQAIEYYEQSLSIAKEVYGEKNDIVATILNNIGTALAGLGDHKKAIEYFEQAVFINKEINGERHPSIANLNNLASSWIALGEHKKAIKYSEQALSNLREIYGEKHHHVAACLATIGSAWAELRKYKKAMKYYEQSLAIVREVYGEKHPNVASSLNNIGTLCADIGEHNRAIEFYEQALSLDKELYGEKHPKIAILLSNIGGAWKNLGVHKKALTYYEQALSIHREYYGEKNPNVAIVLNNIGSAWAELGDFKRAKNYFKQAYYIFREFYGDEYTHTRRIKGAG